MKHIILLGVLLTFYSCNETSDTNMMVSYTIDETIEDQIADQNFRTAILDMGYLLDTDADFSISQEELAAFEGALVLADKQIQNLNGLELFTHMTALYCQENQLTSLDISANENLETLSCSQNQLTDLDLSANDDIITLYCQENDLQTLDVSFNPVLNYLDCSENQLTELVLPKNHLMEEIRCHDNQLTALDLSQNQRVLHVHAHNNALTSLDIYANFTLNNLSVYGNPDLTCVRVSNMNGFFDVFFSNWYYDAQTTFSESCTAN